MAHIVIEGLRKSYVGGQPVLDGVDLQVGDGEFVGLLGPSGCGKSTLLRCVAGLERPDAGRISIADRVITDPAERTFVQPESRNIAMVFQSYALWPHLTVAENVAYPLRRRRVPRAEIPERVGRALDLVELPHLGHRHPSELSGGQQQRVSIARAIVAEPDVLLFDEPLSNLDAALRRTLRREIKALHTRLGTTTLYVTHDQEEIGALADRVAVLSEGRACQLAPPAEIFQRPATRQVAEFVGFDNFFTAPAGADGGWLAVRSESLRLRHTDAPDDDSGARWIATGRITAMSFLGSSVEVEIALDGGGSAIALVDGESAAKHRVGDTVHLGSDAVVHIPHAPGENPAPQQRLSGVPSGG